MSLINDTAAWKTGEIDPDTGAPVSLLRTFQDAPNIVDGKNSTAEFLGISESYIGEPVDVSSYNAITIQLFSDADSIVNGMKFQFSTDGINWDKSHDFTYINENDARTFQFAAHAKYFRVHYTNGTVSQTVFRVQTILHNSNVLTSIHRVDSLLVGDRSTQVMKSVLAGRSTNEDGTYINVRTTPTGAVLTESPTVNFDAFGRQRISHIEGIFDHKQTLGNCPCLLQDVTNGVGAAITYEKNKARSVLEVGSADGEYQIQQTLRYFPYVPGKGQLVLLTGSLRGHEIDVYKRIGLFDDRNGLFFESDGATFNVVRRYYNSGTVQEERIAQADFNFDKLDGTGPSGITFDVTKAHIFTIQYQWLGVGEAVFALNVKNDYGNNIIIVHTMETANVANEVYMSTPTLPVRYEIRKQAATTGPHYLDAICMSVSSEGGHMPPGREYSISNFPTGRVVGLTRTPILAIRLSNTFQGDFNRLTTMILDYMSYSHDKTAFIELVHAHAPTFDGAAVFNPVHSTSAIEYSTNLLTVTSIIEKVLFQQIQPIGKGGGGNISMPSDHLSLNRFISQNYDSTQSQAFIIYATSRTATTEVQVGMSWAEFD